MPTVNQIRTAVNVRSSREDRPDRENLLTNSLSENLLTLLAFDKTTWPAGVGVSYPGAFQ